MNEEMKEEIEITKEEIKNKIDQLVEKIFLILKFEENLYICDSAIMSSWMTLISNNCDKEVALKRLESAFNEVKEKMNNFYNT